jgi:uncharacterized protein YjbJ (UPF0337 family)
VLLSRAAEFIPAGCAATLTDYKQSFSQETHMKITKIKLTGLLAGIVFTFGSFVAYSAETQNDTPLVNKDQVNGRVDEAKGAIKETTGKVLNDKGMEVEGNIQKNVGKAQAGYGDIKQDIKEGK